MTKHPLRTEDIVTIKLSAGAHPRGPRQGMCIMEMVSFLNGESWSDTPKCASTAVTVFARALNDSIDDYRRQDLLQFVPRIIGSFSPVHEKDRCEYLVKQAVNVFAPMKLDQLGEHEHAKTLREIDVRSEEAEPLLYKLFTQGLPVQEASAAVFTLKHCSWTPETAQSAAYSVAAKAAAQTIGAGRGTHAWRARLETLDQVLAKGPSGDALYSLPQKEQAQELKRLVLA